MLAAFLWSLVFPVQRNKMGKGLRSLLVGWEEGKGRKMCPSFLHTQLSINLEVCKNRFLLSQLVSSSLVKVRLLTPSS